MWNVHNTLNNVYIYNQKPTTKAYTYILAKLYLCALNELPQVSQLFTAAKNNSKFAWNKYDFLTLYANCSKKVRKIECPQYFHDIVDIF